VTSPDLHTRARTDADTAAATAQATWDVVTDLGHVELLVDAWRDLLTSSQFFVGPEWTIEWLRFRAAELTPYVVVGRDASGRLVAVLPLARRADGELSTCGAAEGSAHVDVVASPGSARAAADGALAFLAARKAPRIRFERLAEEGALFQALRSDAVEGMRVERVATTCPHVRHEGDWTSFLGKLSKHQRHEVQRQCRRFLDRPGAAVRWVRDPAACEAGIAELFDLHARRFADLERRSVFTGDALRAFHVALATRLAREGRLLLGFLDAEGRTVASAYGFHVGAATYLFQAGIDPEFHATGAGVVLRAHVLRDEVLAAGRAELDLLDGCNAWKLRWATSVRVLFDVDLYPATLSGRARGAVAQGLASLRATAADAIKGMRCPGRSAHEVVDPKYCLRLNCRFAPEAPPATSDDV
jgi:CelD/BcsL family acetyltransferase involved in cellulose biosynthesis